MPKKLSKPCAHLVKANARGEFDMHLYVDHYALLRHLSAKALKSKTGKASSMYGAVKVTATQRF